jgi:inorganic pyrophosphatase
VRARQRTLLASGALVPSPITRLAPIDDGGQVRAVIEAARGTRAKYKFDPELELFVHDKALPPDLVYPLDFGFVPGTGAPDGDPLDIVVLMDEPACVGTVVPCRLVGAIEAEQVDEESPKPIRNDRLVGVAAKSALYGAMAEIVDIPAEIIDSVERFFVATSARRGRKFTPFRRVGSRAAHALIRRQLRDG